MADAHGKVSVSVFIKIFIILKFRDIIPLFVEWKLNNKSDKGRKRQWLIHLIGLRP